MMCDSGAAVREWRVVDSEEEDEDERGMFFAVVFSLLPSNEWFCEQLECPDLKFSGTEKFGRTTCFEHLRDAKFCLAPRGESSWTLRFYESFFVECVPVLLSDNAELPFQNVIDFAQVSIKWPSTRIGTELLDYLASISDRDIEGMIARGRKLRCLFVYSPDSAPCSAVKGILWELQWKVRHFQQSTETFWLHNGSFVNRELVQFSSWRPPMPLVGNSERDSDDSFWLHNFTTPWFSQHRVDSLYVHVSST